MQEGAFSRAGRPGYRNHFAAFDREINPVERRNLLLRGVEDFAKTLGTQYGSPAGGTLKNRLLYCGRIGLRVHHLRICYHRLDAEPVCLYVLRLHIPNLPKSGAWPKELHTLAVVLPLLLGRIHST